MKIKCDVIRDLFPSYLDNLCSEASRSVVEEHVQECEECSRILNALKKEDDFNVQYNSRMEEAKPFIKLKNKIRVQFIVMLCGVILMLPIFWMSVCSLAGEGMSWGAVISRIQAHQFISALSDSEIEKSADLIGFWKGQSVQKKAWIESTEKLLGEYYINELKLNYLNADDGFVRGSMFIELQDKETFEVYQFELTVNKQLGKLSFATPRLMLSSNTEKAQALLERLSKEWTTYYPG